MLAMSTPLPSPAFLLVLASCFVFSGAVCLGCLENDGHLNWGWYLGQPITETDTDGQSGIFSINSPDWPAVGPGVLSPVASITQEASAMTTATTQSRRQSTCKLCGRIFKNSRGVTIHTARMHKSSSSTTSVPVTLPTCTDTADITNSGAAAVQLITPTEQCDRETAAITISDGGQRQSINDNNERQRSTGSVASRLTTRSTNQTTAAMPDPTVRLVCLCGKLCCGRVGLSSHQRSCGPFRRLLLGPIVPADQQTVQAAQTNFTDQQTVQTAQTNSETADSFDSIENENFHFSAADFKLKTNNLDSSSRSQSNIKNHDVINNNNNYLTADRLDTENLEFYFKSDLSDDRFSCEVDCAGLVNHRIAVNRPPASNPSPPVVGEQGNARGSPESLHPLPGVPLPKSDAGWKEMIFFFHAAPIFRFAWGPLQTWTLRRKNSI